MKDRNEFKITMDIIEECLKECLENENCHGEKDKPRYISSR
ncbi:hypothetical protein [Clostridium luticellarii]|jgi:DNA replication protein DnaD|uniref:Uncharacterized protein n=1 Tax=Clostridium luticellarii TaxID=1691940 RepID=A0A2T0BDT8_9CLOT|nr:hypothetical protein [Clostridium luticellarii]PRR82050.1 hypothetical protein CLLU_29550 [Clostridium luticellarii]